LFLLPTNLEDAFSLPHGQVYLDFQFSFIVNNFASYNKNKSILINAFDIRHSRLYTTKHNCLLGLTYEFDIRHIKLYTTKHSCLLGLTYEFYIRHIRLYTTKHSCLLGLTYAFDSQLSNVVYKNKIKLTYRNQNIYIRHLDHTLNSFL
jgi:hypothetical protein